MFESWRFRRRVKTILESDYEYIIGKSRETHFEGACAQAQAIKLSPEDAAAFLIEAACRSLPQPLADENADFTERMSLRLLLGMNRGRISRDNFPRANRLYLLAKGAPVERLPEVDEMVETFMRAMAEGRRNGLVYDAAASLRLLLEMAVSRGLVQRAKIKDMQPGTLNLFARQK